MTPRERLAPALCGAALMALIPLAACVAPQPDVGPAPMNGTGVALNGATTTSGEPVLRVRPDRAPTGVDATYLVYVGAESADLIHRVRLDRDGVTVERTTPVGELALETEGPHGLNVSPDGRYLYMTTAHGIPDGKLWKFHAGPDTLVGSPILLGNFPATLDLTPDGLYAFVVNFNLHGEMVPSTVSVVYTPDPVEVDQIGTCVMPHGLRLEPGGLFAYSNCMMDDELVEIDTRTLEVSRRFSVAKGSEGARPPGRSTTTTCTIYSPARRG